MHNVIPKQSRIYELVVCHDNIIQALRVPSQVCLKLLPRETKQLARDVAMHDVDEVLEFVAVDLQLPHSQLIHIAVFQLVESLLQDPR